MRVAEIMTQATVTDSTTGNLRTAAATMWRQQTGSLVIVDEDHLAGIITERDVLRAIASGLDPDTVTVGEVMSQGVVTTEPDTWVGDAARLMAQHWIRHLPVLEGGHLVGIVSQRDVTGVFAALFRDHHAPAIDADTLVRARRLERLEQGDLD